MTPSPDTPEWLALRRVQRGGVTRTGGGYLDRGTPIAAYLATALDQLTEDGLIRLGDPDPAGLHRVGLTPAGFARLIDLNAHRGAGPGPSWVVAPGGDRSHALDEGMTLTRCGQYLPGAGTADPAGEIPMCLLCTAAVFGT